MFYVRKLSDPLEIVRVKLFDGSSVGFSENELNQYLKDLDADDLIDIIPIDFLSL
jgi:hypothetical protein